MTVCAPDIALRYLGLKPRERASRRANQPANSGLLCLLLSMIKLEDPAIPFPAVNTGVGTQVVHYIPAPYCILPTIAAVSGVLEARPARIPNRTHVERSKRLGHRAARADAKAVCARAPRMPARPGMP